MPYTSKYPLFFGLIYYITALLGLASLVSKGKCWKSYKNEKELNKVTLFCCSWDSPAKVIHNFSSTQEKETWHKNTLSCYTDNL